MKKFTLSPKFRKSYKDTNNVRYFISSDLYIYMQTNPEGFFSKDWEDQGWEEETKLVSKQDAEKNGYIISEDIEPFKIGQYLMCDKKAVRVASVEECNNNYNHYKFEGGDSYSHYANDDSIRLMTAEEIARYVSA